MQDMVTLFREYARLDLMRMGAGLSVLELERWMHVRSILDLELPAAGGASERERRSTTRVPTHLRCRYS